MKIINPFLVTTILVIAIIIMFLMLAMATLTTAMSIESYWKVNLGYKYYIYGKYDCTQYSNDFNDLLIKIGYKTKIVLGFLHGCGVYGKCLHCWLEINGKGFEAVNGKFITDMNRYEFRKYIQRCF